MGCWDDELTDKQEQFFSVIQAVRAVRSLPDGSPCPPELKHTLLVLATYWPEIWPGQERLAVDLGITRATVNKRMRRLEDAGLITRVQRGKWRGQVSTLYRLKLATIRKCAAKPVSPAIHEVQTNSKRNDTVTEGGNGNSSAWDPLPF